MLDTMLYIAAYIGSVAFSLSGYLLGRRHALDLMGVFILSILAANGGGIIRDVLIDRPSVILQSTEPFWIVLLVTLCAWCLKVHAYFVVEKRMGFIVSDAIGLCAFAINGALIGLEYQLHFFGVLTLSLLTATGGGIIRDLIVNEVPEIFKGGFYGSIALLIGATLYVLHRLSLLNPGSVVLVFFLSLALRIIAYLRGWSLPSSNTILS